MNEVDELLLEHFGTKGMKWGVRRDPKTGIRPLAKTLDESKFGKLAKANVERHNARKSDPNRKSRNKKIAIGIGSAAGVAAIAVGALYVKRHMNVPIKKIPTTTSDQHKAFIAEFNARQQRLNSAANQHLRSLYLEADTPIRNRDYLPTWK